MTKRKLLIVCPYPHDVAPSQRLKFEQYFDSFRAAGWELTLAPFVSIQFWQIIYKPGHLLQKICYCLHGYWKRFLLLPTLGSYDIVYVHLWATPFGPPIYEWLLCRLSNHVVYDIDDLVYNRRESFSHRFVASLKGRKKPIFLMRESDHVITCTPYLDKFVRTYNAHTTDISSTVDLKRYIRKNHYERQEPLVIGWSGSLTTSSFFCLLAPVLRRLKKTHNFRLLVMGHPHLTLEGLEIESLSWRADYEVETLQRFDIGVYPLPDEEWVYGKSGLKAIQYMALGIPTIATGVGANFRVIENGVSGYLVNSEEEWLLAFEKLFASPQLRREMGNAARLRVESMFSVEANQQAYLNVLDRVSEKQR